MGNKTTKIFKKKDKLDTEIDISVGITLLPIQDEASGPQKNQRLSSQPSNSKKVKLTNYLKLDDYMTSLDDKSLNKLTTAQLMQRLKAHNLEWKGLKHELIKRWKDYKLKEQEKNN